jgi:hypothetical protein
MLKQQSGFRVFRGAVALGFAALVVGCSERSGTLMGPSALSEPGSTAPAAAPTEVRSVASLGDAAFAGASELGPVRQATARFHDIDKAYAAGYTTANEPCVSSPAGAMGVHAPNLSLIGNPALIPTQPELLLYLPKKNGELQLVGVEYFKVALVRNLATGAVAPWFDHEPWDPAQYQLVEPAPQLFGQTFQGPMPGHTPTMPWHFDLHAWIWAPNPSGMFAEWNPSLTCE